MQEGIYHDNFEGHKCPGCVNLRASLAEVEAQRDMLKRVLTFIKDECDWEPTYHEHGGDERIGDVIREALAKLEAHNGK